MADTEKTPPQNIDPEAAEVVQAATPSAETTTTTTTEAPVTAPAVDQAKEG